jgi:hypothetical protein
MEGYFQAAPGGDSAAFLSERGPVPCQLAEVKRVKAKLETTLKDKSEGEKVGLLGAWLIDQSETFEQREEVQALVAAGNALELERRLLALFDAVINPPATVSSDSLTKVMLTDQVLANLKSAPANVPDTILLKLPPLKNQEMTQEEMQNKLVPVLADVKDENERKNYESQIVNYSVLSQMAESRNKPLDPAERKIRIAKLLVHLSPDPAWQKRVVIVVGLRRYVGAIAAQAVRFRDMYARLEKLIATDQRGFLEQEANLNQTARDRTELANRQSKLKAEKAEELRKEDGFLGQRQTQLKAIQTQLQKIKAEVDDLLVKQGRIEAALFEVQREVAITLDEVYELEAKLAAREQELLKLSPAP